MLKPFCKNCGKRYVERTMFCNPKTAVHEWEYKDDGEKQVKAFRVGEGLVYWYKETLREVPGGAPHGYGFTIRGVFHRVSEGDDLRGVLQLIEKEVI